MLFRSPTKMQAADLDAELTKLCRILTRLLDRDIFPWLDGGGGPTDHERDRASTIVADRLCSAVANPIVRNAQEQRQLTLIGDYLDRRGYRKQAHPAGKPLTEMEPGTYTFRMNLAVGRTLKVNIPVDVVIQPKTLRKDRLPILIEAKSAGDFTNTNKRRCMRHTGRPWCSCCSSAATSAATTWATKPRRGSTGCGNTAWTTLRDWGFSTDDRWTREPG